MLGIFINTIFIIQLNYSHSTVLTIINLRDFF